MDHKPAGRLYQNLEVACPQVAMNKHHLWSGMGGQVNELEVGKLADESLVG